MWITKFLVDVVVFVAVLTAVPKLMGTLVDLARKMAYWVNGAVRKMFKLDDDRVWRDRGD